MTGSLQIKNGKYYAVINYHNEHGKRKQKWVNTNLEVRGNKHKAEEFLNKLLIQDFSSYKQKSDILFCDYLLKSFATILFVEFFIAFFKMRGYNIFRYW